MKCSAVFVYNQQCVSIALVVFPVALSPFGRIHSCPILAQANSSHFVQGEDSEVARCRKSQVQETSARSRTCARSVVVDCARGGVCVCECICVRECCACVVLWEADLIIECRRLIVLLPQSVCVCICITCAATTTATATLCAFPLLLTKVIGCVHDESCSL